MDRKDDSLATAPRQANCFDFLRLFAALAVVVTHSVEHLKQPFLWLTPGSRYWFFDGVALFFILSGLLVYRSCAECVENGRPIRQFYLNRFLRIAPAIYAYAIVTSLVLFTVGAISWSALRWHQYWFWLASNFALVPVYFPDLFRPIGVGVLNGSLWTIPVECSFYLIVPLLVAIQCRFNARTMIATVATLALLGASLVWWFETPPSDPVALKLFRLSFIPHMVFFGIGIFWAQKWRRVSHHGVAAALCLVLYVVVRFEVLFNKVALGPFWEFAWALPLSYAAIWFGYNAPSIFRSITRVGDLSYGVYIWHMVIVNLFLFAQVPSRVGPGTAGPVSAVIALTLGVAAISWWLVEKPALALKPFTSRHSSEAPQPRFSEPAVEAVGV